MKKKRRLRFWICLAVILVGAVFAVGKGYRLLMENMYPLLYTEYIEEEAAKNGLETSFLCAVIRTESKFDTKAVSRADAHGLMQITPETFDWLKTKLQDGDLYTEEDIYDPEVNIHFGAGYLRYLLDRYDGIKETALCAYNAGPGRVDGWLETPEYSDDGRTLKSIPYGETERYVDAVLRSETIYKDLYGL